MKKTHLSLILLTCAMTIFSCKDDDDQTGYPNYSQLKVGNYWIYQQFELDELGNETPKNVFDSVFVKKDTFIAGNVWHKVFRKDLYQPEKSDFYLRDSLHYIVELNQGIVFSSEDFETVFREYFVSAGPGITLARVTQKMEDPDLSVTTEAGTFVTSNFRETFHFLPGLSPVGSLRFLHKRYAANVGMVIETIPFFIGSTKTIERRLVRYHVQ